MTTSTQAVRYQWVKDTGGVIAQHVAKVHKRTFVQADVVRAIVATKTITKRPPARAAVRVIRRWLRRGMIKPVKQAP